MLLGYAYVPAVPVFPKFNTTVPVAALATMLYCVPLRFTTPRLLTVNDVAVPLLTRLLMLIPTEPLGTTLVTTRLPLSVIAAPAILPLIVTPPDRFNDPPTFRLPPIPTPPVTVNAPFEVAVLCVALVMLIAVGVVAPRPVTVCSVDTLLICTLVPVVALTTVSVPLATLITPRLFMIKLALGPWLTRLLMFMPMLPPGVTLVITLLLESVTGPLKLPCTALTFKPTNKLLPILAPPITTRAPVPVLVAGVTFVNVTRPAVANVEFNIVAPLTYKLELSVLAPATIKLLLAVNVFATVSVLFNVVALATVNPELITVLPAIVTLPVVLTTVNLFVFTEKSPATLAIEFR